MNISRGFHDNTAAKRTQQPHLKHVIGDRQTSLQIFNAIDEYGDEALRKALHVNPSSYFTMLNTLCNVTDSALKLEQHRIAVESAATEVPAAPHPATAQTGPK